MQRMWFYQEIVFIIFSGTRIIMNQYFEMLSLMTWQNFPRSKLEIMGLKLCLTGHGISKHKPGS